MYGSSRTVGQRQLRQPVLAFKADIEVPEHVHSRQHHVRPGGTIVEATGLRLDFVWREGVRLFGAEAELKFEARNLTGEDYEEFQSLNDSRIDTNSYRLGRTFTLGIEFDF